MRARLLRREVLPFYLALAALGLATVLVDAVLHAARIAWIGRYLGIPGVLLIVGSFAYSLRKRKLMNAGSPVVLLRWHERMAWAGSLLVLVHAGIHVDASRGWLAGAAMVVNVASGLTGKYLLQRSRLRLEQTRQRLRDEGLTAAQLDERMYWDSLTFDAVKSWRTVHYPITLAFAVLALTHILAIFLFWGWR